MPWRVGVDRRNQTTGHAGTGHGGSGSGRRASEPKAEGGPVKRAPLRLSCMEPLLSPPEAHVIQSFLASIDASANDWPLYCAGNPDDVQQVPVPHTQGREALAKATKDLMSLDSDRWQPAFATHHSHHAPRRPHPQQQHPYDFHRQHQQIHHQIGEQQHHASISYDPFPVLPHHKHSPYPGQSHQQPMQDTSQSVPNTQNLHPLTVPPSRADGNGMHSASSPTSTATSSAATTPSTTTSNPIYVYSSTSLAVSEVHPPPQPASPTSPKQQAGRLVTPVMAQNPHISCYFCFVLPTHRMQLLWLSRRNTLCCRRLRKRRITSNLSRSGERISGEGMMRFARLFPRFGRLPERMKSERQRLERLGTVR